MDEAYKIIIILWAGFFIFLISRYSVRKYNNKQHKFTKSNKALTAIYNFLMKVPVINKDIVEVKNRVYDNQLLDDETLICKAVLYYLLSWLIAIAAFIFVCIYYKNNIFQIAILSVFCYYLKIITLDKLIGDDTELLEGLSEFNDDLIQDYQLYNDINKAVEQAQDENGNILLIKHIDNMKDAIENEEDLENYIDKCSNDYLKLTAINCNLTKEYGDTELNGSESAFIENTRYFNKLINMLLSKRRKLKYRLKYFALMCIVPLLFFNMFDWWVNTIIPDLNIFYKSSWGYLLKIILTIILVAFFFKVRSLGRTDIHVKSKKYYWEDKLLKVKFIGLLINALKPKENTKNYYRYRNLINKSQVETRTEWVILHRILIVVITFIFSLLLCTSIHKLDSANIIANNSMDFNEDVITLNGRQVKSSDMEKDLINSFKNKSNRNRTFQIKERLIRDGLDNETANKISKKVNYKIDKLNNDYIKWYEIVICALLAFLSSWVPIWYLKSKASTTNFNMESEVMLFETIVLILMNFENTTTELILDYFSRFAYIFKNPIDNAIFKLQKGTEEALNNVITQSHKNSNEEEVLSELIEKVDFKPFKNLIKNLIKCEDIRVNQAFSNLSSYRNEYAKTREEEDEKSINKRVGKSRKLALASVILVIFCYIIGPIMLVANYQLDNFASEFSDSSSYN